MDLLLLLLLFCVGRVWGVLILVVLFFYGERHILQAKITTNEIMNGNILVMNTEGDDLIFSH